VHAGAAGRDHGAELLEDQGGAVQVDGEDRLRRGLYHQRIMSGHLPRTN
jgi:hypothetical protein